MWVMLVNSRWSLALHLTSHILHLTSYISHLKSHISSLKSNLPPPTSPHLSFHRLVAAGLVGTHMPDESLLFEACDVAVYGVRGCSDMFPDVFGRTSRVLADIFEDSRLLSVRNRFFILFV